MGMHCDEDTGDHLLYLKSDVKDGVFVKTGRNINERPEYNSIRNYGFKLLFRDNKWINTWPDGSISFMNTQQGLIPPSKGWVNYATGSTWPNIVIYKVPIVPPPPILSIQDDFIQDLAGLYTMSNTTHNGYPYYYGSHGNITLQPDRKDTPNSKYYWYWQNYGTGKKVMMSNLIPPAYAPTGCDGWIVEEVESATVVLSNPLFCNLEDGGYFISKSDPKFCNMRPDCINKVDEEDCSQQSFLASMAISLGIVLLGVGFFLILRHARIMDIQSTNITVSTTGTERNDDIDFITLGMIFQTF